MKTMESVGIFVLAVAVLAFVGGCKSLEMPKKLALDLGNKVTMKLVLIPSGKFTMGSPETERGRDRSEGPQREVTISKPFYMGVTHVTVDQFAAFVNDSGYKTDAEKAGRSLGIEIKDGVNRLTDVDGCSWRNPSFGQTGDHPVVHVSWNDAKAFCEWLSEKADKTVRLPTEAQWEYACRARTKTAYPWGSSPDAGKGWANCADHSLKRRWPPAPGEEFSDWDDEFVFTSPVGSFRANAFGLYDMIGNAWQWCEDRYGDYDKGAATDPTGPNSGRLRVQRGGSWYCMACRSAFRDGDNLDSRSVNFGFRVAVVVPASFRGSKSQGPWGPGQTNPLQDQAAKSLGIPKGLALDLGNRETMNLVLIPAGKFLMGSPETDPNRLAEEGPQYEVTLSKAFYMSIHEVTLAQYEAVMGANPSHFKFPDNPVETVSWNDAVEFCKKLSAKSGKKVRLPTEAEWEYACRAGTKTRFSSGDNDADLGDYAWHAGNSNSKTHPVGVKKPNGFGLYDMHGSVFEWCSHWSAESCAIAENRDPVGPDSGTQRVLRGGCWNFPIECCRSAYRGCRSPGYRHNNIGFRVVVGVD